MFDRLFMMFAIYAGFGLGIVALETSLLSGDLFRLILPNFCLLVLLQASLKIPLPASILLSFILGMVTEMNSVCPRGVYQMAFSICAVTSLLVHQYFPIQTKSRMFILGASMSLILDISIYVTTTLMDVSIDLRNWLLGVFPRALILALLAAPTMTFVGHVQERAVENE